MATAGNQLRYAAHIQPISNCPPVDAVACTRVAFRWVHGDLEHPDNFLPKALCGRRNHPEDPVAGCCSDFALSFYDSLQHAIRKFSHLERRYGGIRQTLGDHVAEIQLELEDGIATPPNRRWGHFDLHEHDGRNFATRCQNTTPIP